MIPSEKTSERWIDGLAFRLLRGHVGDRADDPAFTGERGGRHARRRRRSRFFLDLGEAEVEHLQASVGRDHHVRGFEVAMGDAALVGGADRVGQRDAEREDAVERQAVRRNQLAERLAVDQFEGEERDAVDVLDRMDRDDVRMVERGGGAGLALEALRRSGSPASAPVSTFRATWRPSLLSVGEVDLAHAAFAELALDAVVSELRADHVAGLYGVRICVSCTPSANGDGGKSGGGGLTPIRHRKR